MRVASGAAAGSSGAPCGGGGGVCPAGDQVSRRGALTGGYHDARKSRMEAWRRVDEQKKKLEAEEAERHDIASKVQDILSLHIHAFKAL